VLAVSHADVLDASGWTRTVGTFAGYERGSSLIRLVTAGDVVTRVRAAAVFDAQFVPDG
jgi:hypothetical protein